MCRPTSIPDNKPLAIACKASRSVTSASQAAHRDARQMDTHNDNHNHNHSCETMLCHVHRDPRANEREKEVPQKFMRTQDQENRFYFSFNIFNVFTVRRGRRLYHAGGGCPTRAVVVPRGRRMSRTGGGCTTRAAVVPLERRMSHAGGGCPTRAVVVPRGRGLSHTGGGCPTRVADVPHGHEINHKNKP